MFAIFQDELEAGKFEFIITLLNHVNEIILWPPRFKTDVKLDEAKLLAEKRGFSKFGRWDNAGLITITWNGFEIISKAFFLNLTLNKA